MYTPDIKSLIQIDPGADMPKYLQVSNGVIRAIEQRKLQKGDQLPSLRQLSEQLSISFDTAKKAYDVLKKRNIVVAAHGKSNVVNTSGPLPAFKIFLLFNKIGSHKRILYDSFTQAFTSPAAIDLFIYNNDQLLFRHLLETKKVGYSHFVIIPHLSDDPAAVKKNIEKELAGTHLVLLDKQVEGLETAHASVYEDFENDIYAALCEANSSLSRYRSLFLVLPEESYYPHEIYKGFLRFTEGHGYEGEILNGIDSDHLAKKGDVYIVLTDEDLATVIQLGRSHALEIGKDIGIISYNETPLKEVLLNGITTISTDFVKMGKLAAQQVMSNGHDSIAVPFRLTRRASL